MKKPHLLILTPHYWPGYKAGGPIQSLKNLTERLKNDFVITIMTSDRDFGDTMPYTHVNRNERVKIHGIWVIYLSPDNQTFWRLGQWMSGLKPDVVYINSFFSPRFSIIPLELRWLGWLKNTTFVVAPRGELSQGALTLKTFKKKLYLHFVKFFHILKGVTLHASSSTEYSDLKYYFKHNRVVRASNLPAPVSSNLTWPVKISGQLKLIFLSRVSRKKQLHFVLETLSCIEGSVQLDIYGPVEDPKYWQQCSRLMNDLQNNVQVNYKGEVRPERVRDTLAAYDAFILPTLNENYGHVIFEALAAGCPPIISDQTPWNEIQAQQAGWVLPLSHSEFKSVMNHLVAMSQNEHYQLRQNAHQYAHKHIDREQDVLVAYRELFNGYTL